MSYTIVLLANRPFAIALTGVINILLRYLLRCAVSALVIMNVRFLC